MRLPPALLIISLAANSGHAIAAFPPCTVEAATEQIQSADIERRALAATAEMPLLNELKEIGGKAPDPHRLIGEQLPRADLWRLAEITQQMKQMRLIAYVESEHARDSKVVQSMFDAAWKSYTDANYVPPSDDPAAGALLVMRVLPQVDKPWQPSNDSGCTVDVALAIEQAKSFPRLNAMVAADDAGVAEIQAIQKRYGIAPGGHLDPKNMSPEDARSVQADLVRSQPAMCEGRLEDDLRHIRAWWFVADFVYRTWKEDESTYSSLEHLGNTLAPKIKGMPQDQQILLGLWQRIDAKLPSDEVKSLKFMSKTVQAAQGEN